MLDLPTFLAAIAAHHWPLAVALLVAAGVALARTKTLWIDSKLPASAPPYVTIGLTLLGTVAADVIAGHPLEASLLNSVEGAIGALFIALNSQLGMGRKPKDSTGSGAKLSAVPDPPKTPRSVARMALASAVLFLVTACGASAATIDTTIVKVTDAACMADEVFASIIPAGTPVELVAADVALACQDVPYASVVAFVTSFIAGLEVDAGSADAGAAAAKYVPSPKARAAKAAKFGVAK
jgi:hypothetical protein